MVKEENEEQPGGDAGLQKLFQKIYGDADEVRVRVLARCLIPFVVRALNCLLSACRDICGRVPRSILRASPQRSLNVRCATTGLAARDDQVLPDLGRHGALHQLEGGPRQGSTWLSNPLPRWLPV